RTPPQSSRTGVATAARTQVPPSQTIHAPDPKNRAHDADAGQNQFATAAQREFGSDGPGMSRNSLAYCYLSHERMKQLLLTRNHQWRMRGAGGMPRDGETRKTASGI